MRVTRAQYAKLAGKAPKCSKYGNVKAMYRGERYDSSIEAYRAAQLDLLQKAGKIDEWERGERYQIVDGGVGRRAWYKPDFFVWAEGKKWVEDVKAQDRKTGKAIVTQGFRLKAILWTLRYPDLPLRVVSKDGEIIWRLK